VVSRIACSAVSPDLPERKLGLGPEKVAPGLARELRELFRGSARRVEVVRGEQYLHLKQD
jgi:hypothetical protein